MKQRITPMKAGKTRITDPLFNAYVKMVSQKVLPYQWEVLNDRVADADKSHCIANFRIAAGFEEGCHEGAIFQDTDLYKWLEAVAYCIETGVGDHLVEYADESIDLIAAAQEPDGYINTYYTLAGPETKWTNLTEGHEMYGAGHLIEAAVAYYCATGKGKILEVAKRFADLIYDTFGTEEGKCHGYPGHQEIEVALVRLYRVTGDVKYLNLADYFISERGAKPNYLLQEMAGRKGKNFFPEFVEYDELYAQIHDRPRKQRTAVGHAVRAVYMYSAMADLAEENNDSELAEACEEIYKNIVNKRMYITGGIGSSGKLERFTTDYDLPNDRAYCESCASIGLMMFCQRMAALTGKAEYYDTVERALCNTVLAGISKDADRYFYVNPLEVWPDNCLPSTSMSHVKPVRPNWFPCACCPPNIARTLASLGQYIYSQSEQTLYVNMMISSDVETTINDRAVRLSMVSDYINDGTVKLLVEAEAGKEADIKIRVPAYLENVTVTVNGAAVAVELTDGYLSVPVCEKMEIVISASVPARFVAANRYVRADMARIAITKGPYVYCIEQVDNGDNLAAVSVSPNAELVELQPCEELPGKMPTLEFQGHRVVETISERDELYGTPSFVKEPVSLKAIPYALWCNREPGEMQVWMRAEI